MFRKVWCSFYNTHNTINIFELSGILAKVKEGAEQVGSKIQAKVETVVKQINETAKDSSDGNKRIAPRMEATYVMEVAQLLLSLIHSWGLDPHLDKVCETQLGLLRPMVPVSFGVLSKGGYMSLLLPTWTNQIKQVLNLNL